MATAHFGGAPAKDLSSPGHWLHRQGGEECWVSGLAHPLGARREPQPVSGIHLNELEFARWKCKLSKGNLLEQESRWSVLARGGWPRALATESG